MIGLPFGLLEAPPPQTIGYAGTTIFQHVTFNPNPAQADMRINGDGTIDRLILGSPTQLASWIQNPLPSFDPTDFDFRLDLITGVLRAASDSTGVWIAGGAGVIATWGQEELSPPGIDMWTGTFRMRPSGGGADLITTGVSGGVESLP